MFYLGTYTYLTDITTVENRTFRLTIIDGIIWVSWYIGSILSGPVKTTFGLQYNFVLGIVFSMVAFLYTWLYIKESRKIEVNESGKINDFTRV